MQTSHDYLKDNLSFQANARKTLWVAWITGLTMLVEVAAGYWTGSMALLADGWHMASHMAALFITYLAYRMAAHPETVRKLNFGGGKLIPLGGYTSSLLLLFVALSVGYESVEHLLHPNEIRFDEALIVAVVGLVINLVSAVLLHQKGDLHAHHHHHHDHSHDDSHEHNHHHDQNLHGAFLHVLADALTSVAAIVALIVGRQWNIIWVDAVVGLVAAIIILKWSIGLLKNTSWELLDGQVRGIDYAKIRERIECGHVRIVDLHVWTIAPGTYACELVVESQHTHGIMYFRNILSKEFKLHHIIVEERLPSGETRKLGC